MLVRRALALVGAVSAAAFAACKDVPFAPHWDADMFLPLSTQAIHLIAFFTLAIPPSTSGSVSFPPQKQDVSGAIQDVLKHLVTDPTRARTVLTLTVGKKTAISTTDTLVVAPDSGSLTSANPGRIVFPLALALADTLKTDSITVASASLTMLQTAGATKTPLWVQVRGQATNPGASPVPITTADSLTIKLTVTARIAVSR